MSWISETPVTFLQKFWINVLKCGPIPRHIAFIMDGNRRYATKTHVEKAQGHIKGFDKLAEALQWCRELGITEVTVYAFSIENFKRSREEVETLMNLAAEKFEKFLDEKDKIMEEGVCIRVVGNLSLLSDKLRQLIAEAMLMTRNNTKAFLNVAFAYTSRDEIANTVQTIVEGVHKKSLEVDDIDEDLIQSCLYTNLSPNPQVLLRTSGEVRFSDFLLWQISNSQICFTEVLWPEFCIWHLLWGIFQYQRSCPNLESDNLCKKPLANPRVRKFLEQLNEDRVNTLHGYLGK